MADAIFGVLLEKLVVFIQDEAHHVHEFPGHFKKMKKELLFMQSYLKDADKVREMDRKETLKTCLRELRDLFYDAEDIIAECELMLPKHQRNRASNCMMCCSPSFLMFRYQMGKKLGQINQDIVCLKEKMIAYLGTLSSHDHVTAASRSVRYPVLLNEDKTVGINNDSKKIVKWVLEANGPLTVIGIVGMGGIGKTTLAQKINEDVKKHFDITLIVVLSQSFELKEIIKDLLRKLNVKEELLMRDEIWLLQELHDQLKGKYLLILDDTWKTEGGSSWWESLKSALPERNDGSCIIVTTRNEEVTRSMGAFENRIHRPKLLSPEDSWLLFSKIAFSREGCQCPNKELESIGKDIVAQCGGLPLAIKVVGGMMLGKGLSLFEWNQISDHLKEKLAEHGKDKLIICTLRLSYEELPMRLKPCMMCFATFPEDYEIFRSDIIYWWIGEGFVRGRDEKTALRLEKNGGWN